jgi:hypothetical protein
VCHGTEIDLHDTVLNQRSMMAVTADFISACSAVPRSQRKTEYCKRSPCSSITAQTCRIGDVVGHEESASRHVSPCHHRLILGYFADQVGGEQSGLDVQHPAVADAVTEHRGV